MPDVISHNRGIDMKKIRAAVIGCGSISSMHLDAIHALENVELVGVCDIRRERAEEKARTYNTKAFGDYHDLFKNAKPDAVHLCLPHYLPSPDRQAVWHIPECSYPY